MAITKEIVRKYVRELKEAGYPDEQIEDLFKASLKVELINVDLYCAAMDEIYGEEEVKS